MRRVVVTKDLIIFGFIGEDVRIDVIPLDEVLYVKEMDEVSSEELDKEHHRSFSNVMQIATMDGGYNSGRIYYLSAESKEFMDGLIAELSAKVESARTHAISRTWLRKVQHKLRAHYDSPHFQGLMAILICGVRSLRAAPPRRRAAL